METFNGFVETTHDALLLFEACRIGIINCVQNRLDDKQKNEISHGSCYVFCQRDTGIKRWTDGRLWGPSRILGHFLVYRELDVKIPKPRNQKYDKQDRRIIDLDGKSATVGSKGTYIVRESGLIKKTIAVHMNGEIYHMIAYYTQADLIFGGMETPRDVPELACLSPDPTKITLTQTYSAKRSKSTDMLDNDDFEDEHGRIGSKIAYAERGSVQSNKSFTSRTRYRNQPYKYNDGCETVDNSGSHSLVARRGYFRHGPKTSISNKDETPIISKNQRDITSPALWSPYAFQDIFESRTTQHSMPTQSSAEHSYKQYAINPIYHNLPLVSANPPMVVNTHVDSSAYPFNMDGRMIESPTLKSSMNSLESNLFLNQHLSIPEKLDCHASGLSDNILGMSYGIDTTVLISSDPHFNFVSTSLPLQASGGMDSFVNTAALNIHHPILSAQLPSSSLAQSQQSVLFPQRWIPSPTQTEFETNPTTLGMLDHNLTMNDMFPLLGMPQKTVYTPADDIFSILSASNDDKHVTPDPIEALFCQDELILPFIDDGVGEWNRFMDVCFDVDCSGNDISNSIDGGCGFGQADSHNAVFSMLE
ncbi:hypothetical protein BDV3_003367 [Batrachochytrium dendrobatidis]